jgi:hypothetical protein
MSALLYRGLFLNSPFLRAELNVKDQTQPEDFMFMIKEGARLVKMPGSLNGLDFVLDTVKNCSLCILDRTAQITADEVNDKLYIGPLEGSIFLRDCHNCTISGICRQFRLKKCTNLTIFIHSASDPPIHRTVLRPALCTVQLKVPHARPASPGRWDRRFSELLEPDLRPFCRSGIRSFRCSFFSVL